ncbi:hypothetical protein GB937_010088 [Aspergillus fischeri]|nr:hypothetical protein GB937_010088 [Aspergillus fischeri]
MPRSRSRNRSKTLGDGRRRSRTRSREPSAGTQPLDVIRGYKATVRDPNVSDEVKKHARERVDRYFDNYQSGHGSRQEQE